MIRIGFHTTKEKPGLKRKKLEPENNNLQDTSLVDFSKIILLLLCIKLGLMKNFVKEMNHDEKAFTYLRRKFWQIIDAKIK